MRTVSETDYIRDITAALLREQTIRPRWPGDELGIQTHGWIICRTVTATGASTLDPLAIPGAETYSDVLLPAVGRWYSDPKPIGGPGGFVETQSGSAVVSCEGTDYTDRTVSQLLTLLTAADREYYFSDDFSTTTPSQSIAIKLTDMIPDQIAGAVRVNFTRPHPLRTVR